MTDKKISELDAITGANTAATDVFVVVDTSTGQTKKITREELNNAIEQDVLSSIDIDTINGDFSVNGNINLGDNNIAIFGAGSDLQIYHDGSNSYIFENGTGSLTLQTNGSKIGLAKASPFEWMVEANVDGAVNLYYDSSQKLATTSTGIDVTGTVTADGLTVSNSGFIAANISGDSTSETQLRFNTNTAARVSNQSNTSLIFDTNATERMRIDSSGQVGIGTSSPLIPIQLNNYGGIDGNSNQLIISNNTYYSGGDKAVKSGFSTRIDLTNQDGSIRFLNTSASSSADAAITLAERMRIDSSGQVGIGTSSPVSPLEIATTNKLGSTFTGTTNGEGLTVTQTNYTAGNYVSLVEAAFDDSGDVNPNVRIGAMFDGSGSNLAFGTSNSYGSGITNTAMFINSSGNVGIGTSSPSAPLHVVGNSYVQSGTFYTDAISAYSGSSISINAGSSHLAATVNGSERMRIDSSGNVGIGTSSPTQKLTVANGYGIFEGIKVGQNGTDIDSTFLGANSLLAFKLNGTERMRIDSSGNLLVGTTTSAMTTGGTMLAGGGVGYLIQSHASGVGSGEWYSIFKYGTSVIGSITQSGTTAVLFNTSSDQRLKENIADADDAGSKIDAVQVRQFDWKADGSHQDYGMIAQELQAVAPEAVSGNADSEEMMGVDYSKLVPMLIKEIQSLRNRVSQLEGN
jgi:hypothetical protein